GGAGPSGPAAWLAAGGTGGGTAATDGCNTDHWRGIGGTCDPNHEPATTACGDAEGACTNADYCDGAGLCHDNGFKAATTACGDPADTDCDNADHCTGVDGRCDPNHEPATTACGDAEGACTNADYCDG